MNYHSHSALRSIPASSQVYTVALLILCVLGLSGGCTASAQIASTPAATVALPTVTQPAATPTPAVAAGSLAATELQQLATAEQVARVLMPVRDLRDLAVRLKPEVNDVPLVVNSTTPDYQVGEQLQFWVHNLQTTSNFQITAELAHKTDVAYAWVESGLPYDRNALAKIIDRFSTQTYPAAVAFFGNEWNPGVDNDPRLHILYTSGMGGGIAGYYSSADQYSRLTNPFANEKEMFYINLQNMAGNNVYYESVLAHELQHMIHWHQDRNESIWVNEGLSQYVKDVTGFPQDMSFVSAFMNRPDTQLNTWNIDPGNNANHYGASYLLMRYLSQRYGAEFIRTLVAQPADSIAGIEQALGAANLPTDFAGVFADWVIANYANQPTALGQDVIYGYRDFQFPGPVTEQIYESYPVAATESTVNNFATDYIRLDGAGNVVVTFTGQTETRLFPTQPPTAAPLWWSNRGDMADATLTRHFDLRGLAADTPVQLEVNMWWDLEKNLDYGYVLASHDGRKWEMLAGQRTTSENPTGNSFGVGYTGVSRLTLSETAAEQPPEWVSEQFDLSAYAGGDLWLRFEYITDDGINGAGWLIDDLRIPALNYIADFAEDVSGWESAGWLLTDNRLPQPWLLQVMEFTDDTLTAVRRVPVDGDGGARIEVHDLGNGKRAVLAISALAPVTIEPAEYVLQID